MKEEKALKQKYMCNLSGIFYFDGILYFILILHLRIDNLFWHIMSLYSQILNVEKFIYENILEVPHKIPHQENLTSETVKTSDEKY
ncbi:hypothetical protein CEXT_631972 [Caerostris extrusa]|uniref:Uncharacterized protein n=1 Tax=Caerostris extrusa TaxID=172846 RepID=A0AAV4TBU0_CAEEX|nr:hypothetical protein CEXT_631972 [Caerostris extrusa]